MGEPNITLFPVSRQQPNTGFKLVKQNIDLQTMTYEPRTPDTSYIQKTTEPIFSWNDYREYLLINIVNNNQNAVRLVCSRLALDALAVDTAYKLLDECLYRCRRYNRGTIAKTLLQIWDYTAGIEANTLMTCLGRATIEDDNIMFLLSLYPDQSFANYAVDIAEREQGQYQRIAIPRLYRYFKSQLDSDIVRDLVDLSAHMEAGSTAGELRWVLKRIAQRNRDNVANTPAWIRDFSLTEPKLGSSLLTTGLLVFSSDLNYTGTKSATNLTQKDVMPSVLESNSELYDLRQLTTDVYPELKQVSNEEYISLLVDWRINRRPPSIDQAVKQLSAGIYVISDDSQGTNNFDRRAAVQGSIAQSYARADQAQRYTMMLPVWRVELGTKLENNVGLFRLFGPANPHTGTTFPLQGEDKVRLCSLYGGCRMLLCTCSSDSRLLGQEDADIGDTLAAASNTTNPLTDLDWFTGQCHKCGSRILRKSHAVRLPGGDGGWSGTYCSWDCVRSMLPKMDGTDPITAIDDWDEQPLAAAQLFYIDLCAIQCHKYGIQDYE